MYLVHYCGTACLAAWQSSKTKKDRKFFLSGLRPFLCYVAHTGHFPTYKTTFKKDYLKSNVEFIFFAEKGSIQDLLDDAQSYYQGSKGITENFGKWFSSICSSWKNDKVWGPGTRFRRPPNDGFYLYLPYGQMMYEHHVLPYVRGSSVKTEKSASKGKNV